MKTTLLRASWVVIGVILWTHAVMGAAPSGEGTSAASVREVITLKIEGWTCSSCEKDIRRALEAVPGVKQVSVSFAQGGAVVEVEPDSVSPDRLVAAVDHAGNILSSYRATVVPNGSLIAESAKGGGIGEWLHNLFH